MSWSSGTNTIQEVDTDKSMTLQMIKLKKQGGGTEYFVRKSDVTLGTKSVTQNGTYTAASDGKYGFSQFKVNIKGGNGSAGSDGKPTYTPPSGSTPASGVEPGGIGSAVVGTDPTTGNDAVVGVDSNGNLVTTPVPSGIKIVTPPTKTSYVYQESMDYTGIVVSAIKKDGTTFTDATYLNGHIPMQELIFPVEKAPAASGSETTFPEYQTSGTVTIESLGSANAILDLAISRAAGGAGIVDKVSALDAIRNLMAQYSNSVVCIYVSTTTNTIMGWSPLTVTVYTGATLGSSISMAGNYNPITISTYGSGGSGKPITITNYKNGGGIIPLCAGEHTTGNSATFSTLNAVTTGGTATIPVRWINTYTGATHQDTFQITSTASGGSSSTTTGSSGTEGSGGGGSF